MDKHGLVTPAVVIHSIEVIDAEGYPTFIKVFYNLRHETPAINEDMRYMYLQDFVNTHVVPYKLWKENDYEAEAFAEQEEKEYKDDAERHDKTPDELYN